MASQYTAGELQPLLYSAESVYGTTTTNALTWGGDPISIKLNIDKKRNYINQATNRSFGTTTKGPEKYGFQAKLYNRSAIDWRALAAYAFGSTTALADHEGSFSALVAKKVATAYKYILFNGCKVNKLVISAELPGMPFMFDYDVFAQYATPDTDKTFAGLQAVTVGADPADPAKPVDSWLTALQINLAAGGLAAFPVQRWSLTIDNKMKGQEGIVIGNDTVHYALEAGSGISEGERDIIFEYTIPSTNEIYSNSKLSDAAVTALTIVIGAYTVTLSGGVWEANDFPELKQGLNEETGKIRFNALTIA
jgi:hypothetical protein